MLQSEWSVSRCSGLFCGLVGCCRGRTGCSSARDHRRTAHLLCGCALRAPIQGAMAAAVVPDVFSQDSFATRTPWADCCIRTAQVFVKRCTLFQSRPG